MILLIILKKNLKNVIRNWSSIFLVLIGPLLLIAIVAAAFAGSGFNQITIGYTTNNPEEFKQFQNRISYLGTYHQFPTVESCKSNLERQNVHLCLDVQASKDIMIIDAHVDNTRDLLSYILYGAVQRAAVVARQEKLTAQARESQVQVKDIAEFLRITDTTVESTVREIESETRKLEETRQKINQAVNDLYDKQEHLENLKQKLINKRNELQQEGNAMYNEALAAIMDVQTAIQQSYSQMAAAGLGTPGKDEAQQEINDARNTITLKKQKFDNELYEFNNLIQEINIAIDDINRAAEFLQRGNREITNSIGRLQTKSSELKVFQRQIGDYRDTANILVAKDIHHVVTPIETAFNPLFKGSERLQEETPSTPETKEMDYGSIQTLFPFILAIMISFVGMVLANIVTLDEIHSPAFLRNNLSRRHAFTQAAALPITILLILLVQTTILLAIGHSFFLLDILSNIIAAFAAILPLIIAYVFIGIIIAYLIPDKSTSLLVCAFLMVVSLFLSGSIYPVERMSSFMVSASHYIPFTIGTSMIQQSVFYGIGLGQMTGQFLKFLLILIMLCILLIASREWYMHRRLV